MKKAVIIGASSGIGRVLAKVLSRNGYTLGLTARRINLLEELQKELPNKSYVRYMDITKVKEAMGVLNGLIEEMDGLDLIVINAGVSITNHELLFEDEKRMIDTNVSGFVGMANVAVKYFSKVNSGHIVGMSSIAALIGNDRAPAYNASKAFVSNYMWGLRKKMKKAGLDVTVTDIKPGFVDTQMIAGKETFWVVPAEKAADEIYAAIKCKKEHAYITRRWNIIAWIVRLMPEWLYNKI